MARPPTRDQARAAVLEVALAMSRAGLSPGRSGNASCRVPGGMAITPSGIAYESLSPDDVVFVADDGAPETHRYAPSSEWRFHLAVYGARAEAGAIVHTHSLNATALACTGRGIPAFHYMVAVAGGPDIRCADYATFGSGELARHVVAALTGRRACLMRQHGQLAFAATPAAALELAFEVENLAALYCQVLALGGGGVLSDEEMGRVLARFRDYGAAKGDG